MTLRFRGLTQPSASECTSCHRLSECYRRLAHAVAGETEIEHILTDSTVVRAHRHSAGVSTKVDGKRSARSRGGLSKKTASGGGCNRRPVVADRHRRTGRRYLGCERNDRAPACEGGYVTALESRDDVSL